MRSVQQDPGGLHQELGAGQGLRRVQSVPFFKGENNELLLRVGEDMATSKRQLKKEISMAMNFQSSKILKGSGGAILEDVPHLTDWLPKLPVSLLFSCGEATESFL